MSPPGPGFRLMRDAVLSLAADHRLGQRADQPAPVLRARLRRLAGGPAGRRRSARGVRPGEPLPNLPVCRAGATGRPAGLRCRPAASPCWCSWMRCADRRRSRRCSPPGLEAGGLSVGAGRVGAEPTGAGSPPAGSATRTARWPGASPPPLPGLPGAARRACGGAPGGRRPGARGGRAGLALGRAPGRVPAGGRGRRPRHRRSRAGGGLGQAGWSGCSRRSA